MDASAIQAEVSQRLNQDRLARGMSFEDYARAIGVKTNTIYRFIVGNEKGEGGRDITPKTLRALFDFYEAKGDKYRDVLILLVCHGLGIDKQALGFILNSEDYQFKPGRTTGLENAQKELDKTANDWADGKMAFYAVVGLDGTTLNRFTSGAGGLSLTSIRRIYQSLAKQGEAVHLRRAFFQYLTGGSQATAAHWIPE